MSRLDSALGIALAVTMALVAVSPAIPSALPLAGAASLAVGVLGFLQLRRPQRLIAAILVVTGVAALVTALVLGYRFDPVEVFGLNQTLLGMLAAVSFVATITREEPEVSSRLTGAAAVWRTAVVTHILGAVINLSAVNLVGDHLARRGRLSIANALMLSRAFSPGAFWSPFWAASAVAFTYAPTAQSGVLVLCGLILAVVSLAIGVALLVRAFGDELPSYTGFAIGVSMLRIPLSLAALVIVGHALLPSVDLSVIVLLASLLVTVASLMTRHPRRMPRILAAHVVRGLPRMRGEVTLFTAAGVLSVGMRALVDAAGWSAPVTEFTVLTAWLLVIAMILVSFAGVHPVISIAAAAALFASTHPNPTLFAMVAMIAWGCAAAVGPISGLNVYLAGRYDANGFVVARRNLPYLGVVVILALPVLLLCDMLT
ncbi:hypothetical protein [Microbacterium sp. bgisy207]|uniref:hypothetical protein n=1 Tax=Microbacterium sp. bgisy207 TaxID=3413800 RepID=UPI003EBCE81A